jgi:hypothetical protein
MKKKKLKKRLKKLERTVDWNSDSQKLLALKCSRLDNEIAKIKKAVTNDDVEKMARKILSEVANGN